MSDYKQTVLAELKKQLPTEEYLKLKPLFRAAKTNVEIYNLAEKHAKDFSAIRKASLSMTSAETENGQSFKTEMEDYSKIYKLVSELAKLTGYWHIGTGIDKMIKAVKEKGITVKQLEDVLAPVKNAMGDFDEAVDEALAAATKLGIPSMERNKDSRNASLKPREVDVKAAGSLFSQANLEGNYKFDLKIDVKGKDVPEKTRMYKQLRSWEVRGLINVTEDKWSELHDESKGGKHKDGDYSYTWTVNTETEKIGDKEFAVNPEKPELKK